MDAEALLRALFERAVDAADPNEVVPPCLPPPPAGRVVLVGAGKAAAGMARAAERHYENARGVVVTRYGHAAPCERVEVLEAGHPVPDEASVAASARVIDALAGLGPDDLVVCLISGGGSALLTAPADGLTLADLASVNEALLASGATIREMNVVRKHLSRVKGGRLARHVAPAQLLTVLISDVPGDDPASIASGPTVPDASTFAQAREVVERYALTLPDAVHAHLEAALDETPKPGDAAFANARVVMAASPRQSLEAAAELARESGVTPLILGDALEGESRELGRLLAGIARSVRTHGDPVRPPAVILSGGETTVTLREPRGRGGPNAECALGLALALDGLPGVHALCADTDGIDGHGGLAGAIVGPDTLARARAAGHAPREALEHHDAYGLFEAIGAALEPGPTGTNVNDFRAVLVRDAADEAG